MSAPKAALQLKLYFVVDLNIKALLDCEISEDLDKARVILPASEEVDATLDHAESADSEELRHRIALSIKSKHIQKIPWSYSLLIHGYFDLSPEFMLKPNANHLLCVNGGSMLYTIAREIIYSHTSRGPFGSVMLPTVNFAPQNGVPIEKKVTKDNEGITALEPVK